MSNSIPKIFFESGYLLDVSYERAVKNQPTIESFQSDASKIWTNFGEAWLTKTIELTGKKFSRNEISANLIMHPDLKSCSHPFLININKHLPKPDPIQFSELVFHELLHFYLGEFPSLWDINGSSLLKKYEKEDDHVTAHLHLYAIQKRVFCALDQMQVWDWVVEQTRKAHHPGYERAIEIIGEEGEQPFWNEITN
jgi:hypothetical protein